MAADGTQPTGVDTSTPVAPPNDGGPQPPNAPVQPGSGNPATDPSTNPSAPVNTPLPDGEAQDFAAGMAAFADESPGNFLKEMFGDQGVDLGPPAAAPATPAAPPAPAGTTPVQLPVGNGVGLPPAPPNNLPPQAPVQVDPRLLQQVLSPAPQPPAPVAYAPPGQQPQPQAAPQQQQQAPQAPQAQADPTDFIPFPQGFGLPPNVRAALEHDDPQTRHSALEATIGAAANETAKRVLTHFVQNIAPQMMSAAVNTTRTSISQDKMMEDIFDGASQLRLASPQLIQQCLNVVKADELSRNPGAVWTKELGKRVQSYAVAALQAMAQGQQPQFAPAPVPQPYAPAPAYQPNHQQPYAVSPPEQGQDGAWYVKLSNGAWAPAQPPQAYHPPQQPAPWVAGGGAQPFGGVPQAPAVTPASEWADFQRNGGW